MHDPKKEISQLNKLWNESPRFRGIERGYTAETVEKLRGTIRLEHTLARMGAERLWHLLNTQPHVKALGAMTGLQAVQQVAAGLQAIYLSGWQVAADANNAYETYPDQSLYPANSVPEVVERINNALIRADQIHHMEGRDDVYWFAPIVADAEAGFGGPLNTFELIKLMIKAGAAAVHLEDQISSLKKCGHMGGKVLEPSTVFIQKLVAARLAMDVLEVPTVLIARTDAYSAKLCRNDYDPVDRPFITGKRTHEGFFYLKGGVEYAVAKGLSYAPYADMLWFETSTPDIDDARIFAQGIHDKFPGKLLAYNCSPSFNWKKFLGEKDLRSFQDRLGDMGYKFQFVTLAGFHALNASMYDLAKDYRHEGMLAYSRLQEREFDLEKNHGFEAVKHQAFVGTGYFDEIQVAVAGGHSDTTALDGSTEEEQF
jgi:isocitrate lyase